MKKNVLSVDRDSSIYMEASQIWYHSYWTDGHKDSLTHNTITSDEARRYATRALMRLGEEKKSAEETLKSILDEIETAKKYM